MKKLFSTLLTLTLLVFSKNSFTESNIQVLTQSCQACHGSNGISVQSHIPHLAGQQKKYLLKELKAFQSGIRVNPFMPKELLAQLSDYELTQIADYYAQLPQNKSNARVENKTGENVRAYCVSCHGMTGNTVTSKWANLAGQQKAYLQKQLMDYKSGKRQHMIMEVIANELTNQQIADVAQYYSQQ